MTDETRKGMLKFYGRRKGKPMRGGRMDAYEEILPSVAIAPPSGMLDPLALFPFQPKEVWLEIGFGDGAHLLHQAASHAGIGMIGAEPFINGIAGLCLGIRQQNLKNIRVWPDDARILLPHLKAESIDRCFLLNSDPWPKARHHKRRFIQTETLDMLRRILKPGGRFRMSTDHASLAEWQAEKTFFHAGFSWAATCKSDWADRPADLPETRYQKKGAKQGRPTVFLDFIRK